MGAIETERLRLRPFAHDDFAALRAMHSRDDVARWLYWEPRDDDEVREALERKITRTTLADDGDSLSYAVELRATGGVIGDVVLFLVAAKHRGGEIGFIFHPDHQGHGYGTEAAREMLRLGFESHRLHRLTGRAEPRNTASCRVLEKLGMRREALFVENEFVKGEWQNEVVYAMLEREWRG